MTQFTKEDLLGFNEMLLGRGMPTQQDGVGYNKADYGACSTYFFGLSDAQLADLAKRLVKYTNTQLKVDKDIMKETASNLAEIANGEDRSNGISVDIKENGTLISFRYNESFIEVIKSQPKRQWDGENKNWIIPNDRLNPILNELMTVGADVKNALLYASSHPLIQNAKAKPAEKVEILTKLEDDFTLLKFVYNRDVLEVIKNIDIKDRQWNPSFKFWAIKNSHLKELQDSLSQIAVFKQI